MSFDIVKTNIPGGYEINNLIKSDSRGTFIKTFNKDLFESMGLRTDWKEHFHSTSEKGVLRGLHFQTPPYEHAKLIYSTYGEVMDVMVDIRKNSPTYGQHTVIILSAAKGNMAYLPAGTAHGFYVLSKKATLVYNLTSVYAPSNDEGVRWDSVGINWPDINPHVSERDRKFIPLGEFITPFDYDN